MRVVQIGTTALPDAIATAVDVLRGGGIVAYPTDTLYGLGVDPRNTDAVDRLFDVKGRDAHAAVPLIAASVEQAQLAGRFGEVELRLAQAFWPGPLSIVVPASADLSQRLLAGGTTVAIRVPAHDVARGLASAYGYCLTSTSANPSGRPAAASGGEIDARIAARVALLLDDGPAPGGPPSTIVEVTHKGVRLVRDGALAWDRVIKSLE